MNIRHPDIMTRPDPARKEKAIAEALRHYRRHEVEVADVQRIRAPFFAQWKGFAAGAFATVLVMLFVAHGTVQKQGVTVPVNAEEVAMLHEMKQLFGNQLQGVVQNGGDIQPILSSTGTFTNSQPIMITLQQGGKTIRILSFSGNTVNVPLQGGAINFSAYVGKDGKVLVEGDDFIWSQDKSEGSVPAHMDAKTLGTSL